MKFGEANVPPSHDQLEAVFHYLMSVE